MTQIEDFSEIIWEFNWQIEQTMNKEDICGLAAALVNRGGIIWAKGYGFTDRTNKENVTPETLFSIQSMTKTFTATAFLILNSKGIIDLDDPIRRHYPGFTVNTKFGDPGEEIEKITFRRMLSHWASFTHEAPIGNNYDNTPCSFREHIESISNTWLRSPVGSEYTYSNLGFDLTGFVMGKIADMTYEKVMRKELFDKIGITTATFDINEALEQSFAKGHYGQLKTPTVQIPILPSGALYISVLDVAKFVQFHLNKGKAKGEQLITDQLFEEMYRPQFVPEGEIGYGLGLYYEGKIENGKWFHHGGGGYGYLTMMTWLPEYNIGVVILTNDMNHQTGQSALPKQALELVAKEKEKEKIRAKDIDLENLKKLQGTYFTERRPFQNIVLRNDKLFTHSMDGGFHELVPLNKTEFQRENEEIKYIFECDDNGFPEAFYCERDGLNYRAKYNDGSNDEVGKINKIWEKYLGVYQYQAYGLDLYYSLFLKNNRLNLLFGNELKLAEHTENRYFTVDGEELEFISENQVNYRNIPGKRIKKSPEEIITKAIENNEKEAATKAEILSFINAFYHCNSFEETKKLIDKICSQDDSFIETYEKLGKRLFGMNRLEQAIDLFTSYLHYNAEDKEINYLLAKAEQWLTKK
ncbi:MAG: serine hydrolase [Candidatus Heimdallarchaeota archaeon]|nr:serine hydrolase [Candidatus Heimdallarchaeota archaeon]